jgi:NTE family protein
MRRRKGPSLGIVFGGGAARGFAHIGVIQVLEEAGLQAQYVSGCSVGSLIAALYCGGYSSGELIEIARSMKWKKLVTFRLRQGGMFIPDKLEELIDDLLQAKDFKDLQIPLGLTAVDIGTGEQVVLHAGSVSRAARASSTVPGFFVPIEIEGRLLIDGGMVNSLPGDVVKRMGADVVLGINLNGSRVGSGRRPKRAGQIVKNTMNILVNNNLQIGKPYIDVLVSPEVGTYAYGNLRPRLELIELGAAAMREALPQLQNALKNGTERGII